jgi:zinc transporter
VQELVIAIIERLADRVATYVDEMEERIVVFEEEAETKEPGELRNAVADLRRQIAMVRRFLAPQRDALEAFSRLAESTFSQAEIFAIREQSDRITRYVEDLDLVRERALVVQEELLNRINQEQNNRMYVLSIVAAVFLPISFISGFFGMNTAGLPGVEEDGATYLVIGLMVIVTLSTLVYFRLRRWL